MALGKQHEITSSLNIHGMNMKSS